MRCGGSKIAVIYGTFLSEGKHGLVVDTFRAEIEKNAIRKYFMGKKYLGDFTSLWAGGDSGQKFATGENWTGFNCLISLLRPPSPPGLSSAMSRAANRRLAELELAGSSTRFRFISKVFRVREWPGLLILNSQGIQLRNSHRICTRQCAQFLPTGGLQSLFLPSLACCESQASYDGSWGSWWWSPRCSPPWTWCSWSRFLKLFYNWSVKLNNLSVTVRVLPIKGLSEVIGMISDTVLRNIVRDSKIVTPLEYQNYQQRTSTSLTCSVKVKIISTFRQKWQRQIPIKSKIEMLITILKFSAPI